MIKHKIHGFLTALLLAVISFFIIFLFCPEFSEKYLGVNLKSKKAVEETVKDSVKESVDEIVDITKLLKK